VTLSAITCASGCVQRDRHLTACPCADPSHEHAQPTETYQGAIEDAPGWSCHWCSGCLPRLAGGGLAVCPRCEQAVHTALAELPDLWVDLAERPRLSGVSRAPASESEPAAPAGDEQIAERSVIKSILVTWCKVLEEDHSVTVPVEARIAATTRRIAAWESDQARQCRDAAFLATQPHADGTPPVLAERAAYKRDEHRHAKAAQVAREDRETGRDILRAICEHLSRHSGTLLAAEHAGKYTADVTDARQDAKRKANTGRALGIRIPCPECGNRTRMDLDTHGLITCQACGACGDAAWWSAQAAEPPQSPALEEEIIAWMLVSHRMDVKGPTIRKWASRGKLSAAEREDGRVGYDPLLVADLTYRALERRAS
jgi:ribosomal protein S27E